MENTLLFFKTKIVTLFIFILISNSNLTAQSDTLIIGYNDGTSQSQKAILPTILNMQTVDSILLFNQYKYVLPNMIDINQLNIPDSLREVLLSEFGHNTIFDAEEKKRLARKTSKETMAGAEGSDLNLELELNLPDNYFSECGGSYCINGMISPITNRVCSLSVINNEVKIAIMDTGVDPSIANSLSYDCVQSSNSMPIPSPAVDYHSHYHGTKVAEEIVAATCCSDSIEIINIRVLDSNGKGRLWNLLRGIEIAINENVCILNISAGFTDDTTLPPGIKRPFQKAIEIAGHHGLLVVTSAGNASDDNDILPHFPSNYSYMNHVIAVGASCEGNLEGYSNIGRSTVTLTTEGDYSSVEKGTSYAAGVVSGFAGLLQMNAAEGSFCDPQALKNIIELHVNGVFPAETSAGGELMPYETLLDWQPKFQAIPLIVQNGDHINQLTNSDLIPSVYPSPFKDQLTIELVLEAKATIEIAITNLNGQVISQEKKEGHPNKNIWKLDDLASLESGIYLLQVKINDSISNQKIVKF